MDKIYSIVSRLFSCFALMMFGVAAFIAPDRSVLADYGEECALECTGGGNYWSCVEDCCEGKCEMQGGSCMDDCMAAARKVPPGAGCAGDTCSAGCAINIKGDACGGGCTTAVMGCMTCTCIFCEYDASHNPIACGCR